MTYPPHQPPHRPQYQPPQRPQPQQYSHPAPMSPSPYHAHGGPGPYGAPPPGGWGYGAAGPGGPYGPPPPKKRTGLWAGISAAGVLTVAAFLITGLWAPGFLTGSDDAGDESSAASPAAEGPVDQSDPQLVAERYLVGLNRLDDDAVSEVSCREEPELNRAELSGMDYEFSLAGDIAPDGPGEATVAVKIESSFGTLGYTMTLSDEDGWCVRILRVDRSVFDGRTVESWPMPSLNAPYRP